MKPVLVTVFLMVALNGLSQQPVQGVIADSATRSPLAFATVRVGDSRSGMITGIDGRFSINASSEAAITFTHIGYRTLSIQADRLRGMDTVYLAATEGLMSTVIVRSASDRIRRIINTAIRNRPLHNPDQLDTYQCNIYFKSWLDFLPDELSVPDTVFRNARDSASVRAVMFDSSFLNFIDKSHLFFTETYSHRIFQKPHQVQEVVLASKFSGLSKTYFANIITDNIPFHVYTDFITLGTKDYTNPIAPGWQQRYSFRLEDELVVDRDTVFMLSFHPKGGRDFNGMKGMVYINTNGYAITHFIGSTIDPEGQRGVTMEQIYTRKSGRWFPCELNFESFTRGLPVNGMKVAFTGRSVIDSVSYEVKTEKLTRKSRPVVLHDSVDLRTAEDWARYRRDSLSPKESNTYRVIDSFSRKYKMEPMFRMMTKAIIGRVPIGSFDLEWTRLATSNAYEGVRLGAGIFTNERISRYVSIGGWFGYGTRDAQWKYGGSLTLFPAGRRDDQLVFSYDNTYRTPGDINLHPELDRTVYTNLLLKEVDRIGEYAIRAQTRRGYFELQAGALSRTISAFHDFELQARKFNSYSNREAMAGVRFAYA
ncbi:MAG TPA: DUF5686 family protein, partial [Flavisolibacter sp.]